MELTSSMAASNSIENPSQLAFLQLKRLLDVVACDTITRFTVTYIGQCCVRGMGSRTEFLTHIRDVWRYKYAIRAVSFFNIAHCSIDSPSLFVVVYPQSVLWLLKSPMTMWGLFLCHNAGSWNGSGGGLYMKCTTTPGSSTVMSSTFPSSYTEMLFIFRSSLIKTELPCLLCATSVIPRILGLAWSLDRCISWRQRHCCSLHITDSMDALLAVRPSTFADITVIATEGPWLWTPDMVCKLMLWKNK